MFKLLEFKNIINIIYLKTMRTLIPKFYINEIIVGIKLGKYF
jgi:hypothetical protein